jgi:hypothetical protein
MAAEVAVWIPDKPPNVRVFFRNLLYDLERRVK